MQTRYANQTYGPEVIQANGVLGLKGNYMFYVGYERRAAICDMRCLTIACTGRFCCWQQRTRSLHRPQGGCHDGH